MTRNTKRHSKHGSRIPNRAQRGSRYDNQDAQNIHRAVLDAVRQTRNLEACTCEIYNTLKRLDLRSRVQIYKEISINGADLLTDILHLPSVVKSSNPHNKINSVTKSAIERALFVTVWQFFTRFSIIDQRDILRNITTKKCGQVRMLQQAMTAGNRENVKDILELLKQDAYQNALRLNLENISENGSCVLQQAFKSGNRENIKDIIELLRQDKHKHALYLNLKHFSNGNLSVLQHVFSRKYNNSIIYDILNLYMKHPETFKKHIGLRNWSDYNCFHQTTTSSNHSVFFHITAIYRQFLPRK